jgi:hypothetical protein
MSDEQSTPTPPAEPDVPPEKIVEFFERVGVSDECPICKTRKWVLPHPDHGGILSLPNPLSTGQTFAVPAYLVVCSNCQFMRLHAKITVDEKIAGFAKEGT